LEKVGKNKGGGDIHRGARYLRQKTCGLYYKPVTIVNDDSRVITKLETSLTDDAIVIIYDHHMFIVQATGSPDRVFNFVRQFD
jgi:hypothetical protein